MSGFTTADAIAALRRRHSHVNGKWGHMVEFMLIDFVAVACQAADKFAVHGYEIKVSRSDWIKELNNPDKAEPGMAMCDFWYLAAPKGILKDGELPEGWGYVEVSETRSVLKVKPKRLRPVPKRNPTMTANKAMINSPEWTERASFAVLARRLAYEQSDREELQRLLEDVLDLDVTEALDRAATRTNRLTSRQREAIKRQQADQRQRRRDEKAHFKHRDEGIEYGPDCPYGWCAQFASMKPE